MTNPLVSIIIPTKNSEKTLPLCLASIKKQLYKNIEILVIDSYSTDKTIDIAKKFNAKIIQIKGERTKAKNIGLKLARGKYVLFIDSDMVLTPQVVSRCVSVAEKDPRVAGVIIPEISIGFNYWARVRAFERLFYIGTMVESPRFFRREAALEVGGFDEDLIFYEEATLPHKLRELGYKVDERIDAYILHYEDKIEIKKWIRKKYYYGKTLKKYKRKYRQYSNIHINPVYRMLIFLSNKRFLRNPTLALGVIVLKTLEYMATLIASILG